MTQILQSAQTILLFAIPIIFAITVHEVAHGWMANKLGDPTAKMLGRLTLNPIKHIDIIGTIIVPAVLYYASGFLFGWAKPVPITWQNLRHPRRDAALVAAAGPLSNLLMAIIWVGILKFGLYLGSSFGGSVALIKMGEIGLFINLILLVLNLFPIPPLDGSRVVSSLLPPKTAWYYNRIEPFGFLILLALIFLGLLGKVLMPIVTMLGAQLLLLFGISN